MKALSSRTFWQEIAGSPRILRSWPSLKLLLRTVGRAGAVERWVERDLARLGVEASECIAYSFWCHHSALGLVMAKRSSPT